MHLHVPPQVQSGPQAQASATDRQVQVGPQAQDWTSVVGVLVVVMGTPLVSGWR